MNQDFNAPFYRFQAPEKWVNCKDDDQLIHHSIYRNHRKRVLCGCKKQKVSYVF